VTVRAEIAVIVPGLLGDINMPYKKGYSKSSIGSNISHFKSKGYSPKRAVAASLSIAADAAKAAGKPSKAPKRKKSK
jgi:hypothetical protein